MTPNFSLPNVYSDHMVFQRGMPITIAGTAPAHSRVTVSFDGDGTTVSADRNGDWSAEFPALPAGTGHAIKVFAPGSGAAMEFKDIAVGDVWIAGGQSNMEFPVMGPQFHSLPGGDKIAAAADDPDLRILHVQHALAPDGPCREFPRGTEWRAATSPVAVWCCSAVGYIFGQLLRKRLGVPVGIISTNWGGCRIEPWIDEQTLRRHRCSFEVRQIDEVKALGGLDAAACGRKARRHGPDAAQCGLKREDYTLPATLFNGMLAPLSPLRVRGAIWYQGESNASEWRKYRLFQKLLVESWRRATRSPDMAFIQVQLAGFARHSPTDRLPDDFWRSRGPEDSAWSKMREVQREIRKLPLCDLVTATDIGDHSDIHPADKGGVARRLDAVAGKMLYGAKGAATGPSLKAVRRRGAALVCSFADTGLGLEVRDTPVLGAPDLKPPKDTFLPGEHAFLIAPARGAWVWAGARLAGNTVVVSSPEVPSPARVRYAWGDFPPSMRLFNKDGFPAFPFDGAVEKKPDLG